MLIELKFDKWNEPKIRYKVYLISVFVPFFLARSNKIKNIDIEKQCHWLYFYPFVSSPTNAIFVWPVLLMMMMLKVVNDVVDFFSLDQFNRYEFNHTLSQIACRSSSDIAFFALQKVCYRSFTSECLSILFSNKCDL